MMLGLIGGTIDRARAAVDLYRAAGERAGGWPENLLWALGVLEVAGAAGLITGLFWWPLGVAAATGVTLYFVGAVISHLRVRDREWQPAVVMGLIAVAVVALRILSA